MRKLIVGLVCLLMTSLVFNVQGQVTYFAALNNNLFGFNKNFISAKSTFNSLPISDLYFQCRESIVPSSEQEAYLDPSYQNASILTKDGQSFSIPARYRVLNDEMQIYFNHKNYALHTQVLQRITLNDKTFGAFQYVYEDDTHQSYFQVINEGKLQLLKKYFNKKIKAKTTTSLTVKKYELKSKFYILEKGGFAKKIKMSKKNLYHLMEPHLSKVKKYIKSNKLSIKDESHLKLIFEFYNRL